MTGVDTNILVRFLTGDDTNQSDKVYRLFKQVESEREELYVSTLVVIELIWVLESMYQFERQKLLKALENLTLMSILKFENPSAIHAVVREAKVTHFDLSDLFIAHTHRTSGVSSILTFDKKASKHNLFKLLS